ncbi:MAG: hypothetical protein QM755_04410 [Luteolibacter sp.]
MLDPEEVCRRYQAQGYDFLALTDHFIGRYDYPIVDTRSMRTESFTTILGAELHSGAMSNGSLWHILAVGLPDSFAPSNSPTFAPCDDQESGPEIATGQVLAVVRRHRPSPMVRHDLGGPGCSITAAHAVEIYNHTSAVNCDRPDGFVIADLLLSEGRDLTMIATDDAHFSEPSQFGGWVMVKAEENEPEALLAALKAGHFYSSQGPELHDVWIEDGNLVVESSAVVSVVVLGRGTLTTSVHGSSMTRTVVSLERFKSSPWLRVSVIDAAGKRAWSNPIRAPLS